MTSCDEFAIRVIGLLKSYSNVSIDKFSMKHKWLFVYVSIKTNSSSLPSSKMFGKIMGGKKTAEEATRSSIAIHRVITIVLHKSSIKLEDTSSKKKLLRIFWVYLYWYQVQSRPST